MRIEFRDIIDTERSKKAIVLGLGPSVNRHEEFLRHCIKYRNDYCIISCNNIDRQIPSLKIDHWILAQPADHGSDFYIPHAHQRYTRDKDTVFYYTDCLDLTPRDMVDRLLADIRFIGYDQRHNNSEECGWTMPNGSKPSCCARIVKGRKTIQEEFRDYTGCSVYGAGDTVSVHMAALAVMLGCKEIIILGVDLDYSQGYINNDLPETKIRTVMGMNSVNRSPQMVKRVLEDLTIIKNCADNVGATIYCMDNDLKISKIFPYKKFEHAKA